MRPRLAVLAPDLVRGVRAAIATVVPFYLADALDRPALAWVALGGWLGSLADPGGTRRARVLGLATFVVAGGLVLALGGAVEAWPALAAIVVGAVGFAASMARAAGGSAGNIGNTITIVAAIGAAAPVGDPIVAGALFAAGALWSIAVSSVVWPIWPHRPLRLALARVFAAEADYAAAIADAARGPDAAWAELARAHQRAVRAALEQARDTMVALRARHAGVSPVGINLRLLLGDAEQQFFRLIALADAAEVAPAAAEVAPAMDELVAIYRRLETRLITRRAGAPVASIDAAPDGGAVGALARELVAAAQAAAEVARDLDVDGDRVLADHHAPAARTLRGDLAHAARAVRDAFAWRSPTFHHAVRVAIAGAAALVIGRVASTTHASWVTVTALAVLQPYFGNTLARTFERVIGTFVGGAIAVAMMMAIRDPFALAIALAPMVIAAVVTRPRSYRLFVLFLTPVFVLVTDRWHPSIHTAVVRLADVALGALVALCAAAVVPSVERTRLPEALAGALDAIGRYVRLAFDALPARGDRRAMDAARRDVGVALEAAEASLERMLAEPRALRRGAAGAVSLLTYGRRVSGALTALGEVAAAAPPDAPPPEMPTAVRDHVLASLDAARRRLSGEPDVAAPPPLHPPAPAHLALLVHYAELVATAA